MPRRRKKPKIDRCPECGGMVVVPCGKCAVQASGEPRSHANRPDDAAALALHLRSSHEAARLEMWRERLKQDEIKEDATC
jgi:hypothetical protein